MFTNDCNHAAYTRLGVGLAEKGQTALASAAFTEALRLRPENVWPFMNLQRDPSGSADYDHAGLALAPPNPSLRKRWTEWTQWTQTDSPAG